MSDAKPIAAAPNLQILRTLIAKDWRIFRVPLLALIIAGAACYALGFFDVLLAAANARHTSVDLQPWITTKWLIDAMALSAGFALGLTLLIASAFGGMAIAGERADRTADFMGLLPVTRMQIVLSKWIASLSMLGVCFLFHGVVMGWMLGISPGNGGGEPVPLIISMLMAETLCTFGIAWLFGSFMQSGTISACLGIAAMFLVTLLAAASEHQILPDTFDGPARIAIAVGMVGLVGILAGANIYHRRVQP